MQTYHLNSHPTHIHVMFPDLLSLYVNNDYLTSNHSVCAGAQHSTFDFWTRNAVRMCAVYFRLMTVAGKEAHDQCCGFPILILFIIHIVIQSFLASCV